MKQVTCEQDRYRESKRVTVVGMFVNSMLAVIKILVGIIGHSSALFADGIHSLSDLLSDFMVLLAAKHAGKVADFDHPYGHERIETLATMALSVMLTVVGVLIAYHAFDSWYHQALGIPDQFTVYAAILSILANEGLFRYTMVTANRIDSDLLRANAWHSRSDMYSSVIVLVGLIGALFGVLWMDALAALIVAYMIAKMGVKWSYKSLSELIDTGVDIETLKKIEAVIENVDGVKRYHCLRTRKMAGQIMLDVHVLVDSHISASEGHAIGECVRTELACNIDNIKDITVHIDVFEHPEHFVDPAKLPPSRSKIIVQLLEHLKLKNNQTVRFDANEMLIYYDPDKIRLYLLVKEPKLKELLCTKQFSEFKLNEEIEVSVFVFYQRST